MDLLLDLVLRLAGKAGRDRRRAQRDGIRMDWMKLRVAAKAPLAERVTSFELRAPDGAAWTDPNVVLSIIGIVVSMGMAYQMLQDVKARMLVLEQQAASKETVAAVTARLDRIEKKLDTLLMERPHGE